MTPKKTNKKKTKQKKQNKKNPTNSEGGMINLTFLYSPVYNIKANKNTEESVEKVSVTIII